MARPIAFYKGFIETADWQVPVRESDVVQRLVGSRSRIKWPDAGGHVHAEVGWWPVAFEFAGEVKHPWRPCVLRGRWRRGR